MTMPTCQILTGDCREVLRTLPDETVNCCVTSPPYFGLRDYGVAGQIGMEKTPETYVAEMVSVFQEVRRVLRKDGTCWLNLGDCYAAAGGTGTQGATGQRAGRRHTASIAANKGVGGEIKPKDLIGIPWMVAFALRTPYKEPSCVFAETDRSWLAAMLDGEGCIGIRRFRSYRGDVNYQNGFVVYSNVTNNDIELLEKCRDITRLGGITIKQKAGATDGRQIVSRRDSFSWRVEGNGAVDVIRAAYPYLIAKRKQACLAFTLDGLNKTPREEKLNGRTTPSEIQEKKALLWDLIKKCNQRVPVDLPNWVEEPTPKITPGWYLRSDIIWAKPNPMPESVTDRPTKAHEYLFLLTKSERYTYDANAIREPHQSGENTEHGLNARAAIGDPNGKRAGTKSMNDGRDRTKPPSHPPGYIGHTEGRNKRSVWTVPTHGFPGAHFATFPPDLIRPCIRAGCPLGGVVLDPFGGSGTTGQVALEEGRSAILIELNRAYIKLAEIRSHTTPSML